MKVMAVLAALLVSALGISMVHSQQFIIFPRCKTSELRMEVIYANPSAVPYDLFASTRRSTCGKRAGTTTGNGTYSDPYVISVDLSKGLSAQTPDCGIVQTGADTYRVLVSAVFACDGPSPDDKDFTFSCTFNLPTTTSSPLADVSGVANYSCQAPSTIMFTYEQPSSAPGDVYASGKEVTCSRSAGQGSGRGVSGDPYVVHIDVTNTSADCGVTTLGASTYAVEMYVQQIVGVITSADVTFPLTCNFSSSGAQVVRSGTVPAASNTTQDTASQLQPSASLYVVSSSAPSVVSAFTVGDRIRLAAQLLAGPATGLRVRECTSSPGPGLSPVLQLLNDKGCSSANSLVPPFVTQDATGALAFTDSFSAFKFNGYDTVYFECVINFCFRDNDLECQGTHCSSQRRRREAADLNSTLTSRSIFAYVTVQSDITDGHSGGSINQSSSRADDGQKVWTPEAVIVVAVLCVGFLLTLVLCIILGVKVATLTSCLRSASKQ